eukprot:jgi/Botrbrau1/20092/Bobra.0659s0001.1
MCDQDFVCGGCASKFKTIKALHRHWIQKKSHSGLVFKPLKRRRAEELDVGVDDKERKTSKQQRLGSCHDFASNMLPAISRTVCSARTTYDTVVMDEGRIGPSMLWASATDNRSTSNA